MDHQLEVSMIRRAKEGDAAAFSSLIEAHQTRLYRFLLKICRNPDLAPASDSLQTLKRKCITSPSRTT